MPKQSIDLHELLQHVLLEAHAAWRFRWHALIAAWAVALVGIILLLSLPAKYEATAQVYADTGSLQNPLLHGIAVQPDVRGRLDIITHTLLSRPNLETVADKTGLAVRATTPRDKDELLARLGNAVKIRDAGAKNLYNIAYADTDPHMAQHVVQAFVEILMDETLGANSSSAETAQKFLQQQVDDYANRLNEADQSLANFRKANLAWMPSKDGDDYFARLRDAEADLDGLKAQRAQLAAGGGHAHVVTTTHVDPEVAAIDAQIDDYQKQLDNLLLRYTDQYPDVVNTRRMIAQLRERRAALPASAATGHRISGGADLRGIDARIAAQEKHVASLKASVDKASDVQTTLQRLTRNYSTTKRQYDDLVSRLNTAQMSRAATQSGNNLKFRIVDPPVVPLIAVSPKRGLLLLVVLAFALGIAIALAYFLHKLKPVFTSLKSLREFGDLPVIGSFGMMVSPVRRERRRREVAGFCAGMGLLLLVMIVSLAFDERLSRLVQHVLVVGAA